MKALTLDEIQGLLKKDEIPSYFDDVEMRDCEYCGNCEEPDNCVYGVQCPQCEALPREQCSEGRRVVGLHEARHKHANSPYWRYYRG